MASHVAASKVGIPVFELDQNDLAVNVGPAGRSVDKQARVVFQPSLPALVEGAEMRKRFRCAHQTILAHVAHIRSIGSAAVKVQQAKNAVADLMGQRARA